MLKAYDDTKHDNWDYWLVLTVQFENGVIGSFRQGFSSFTDAATYEQNYWRKTNLPLPLVYSEPKGEYNPVSSSVKGECRFIEVREPHSGLLLQELYWDADGVEWFTIL